MPSGRKKSRKGISSKCNHCHLLECIYGIKVIINLIVWEKEQRALIQNK